MMIMMIMIMITLPILLVTCYSVANRTPISDIADPAGTPAVPPPAPPAAMAPLRRALLLGALAGAAAAREPSGQSIMMMIMRISGERKRGDEERGDRKFQKNIKQYRSFKVD